MENETRVIIFLVITALVSYFIGGLNGALITSIRFFRKDVRKFGSGNAGLTNFVRVFGTKGAIFVILVDVLKTLACTMLGRWLLGTVGYPLVGTLFGGFCAMMGHAFPIYYRLHGGKALLCAGILAWLVDWRVGLICWSIFFIVVVFTKYISLGSIVAALFFPATILIFDHQTLDGLLALMCVLLVLFAHRANIVRLIKGTETKFSVGEPD
jgi:glycerol-3-phosphate acyltransferase PlsY